MFTKHLAVKYTSFTDDYVKLDSVWKIQTAKSHFEMGRVKPEDAYGAISYG